MAVKTFTTGEVLTAADTNTYLANAGLVYIKTATVTNAADSGTAFRSIFTSTYDAYRIVCHTLTANTNASLARYQFLYSTSTAQNSGNYGAALEIYPAGGVAVQQSVGVANGTYLPLTVLTDNLGYSSFVMDIYQAGSSGRASTTFQTQQAYTGAGGFGSGLTTTTRTYDGILFFMSTGNISMTATVYGYRKG